MRRPERFPWAPLRTAARLVVLAALTVPLEVQAHTLQGEGAGFLSGIKHPVSGWDHVIAMIAVGLWGAQLGAPAIWLLPVTFPLIMACGGFLGLVGVSLPGIELGIAISGVLLGGAVLLQWRPPLVMAALIVGFFGLFHGYAHGAELPAGQNAMLYSLGFVIATGLLHATGIALGAMHRWPWGRKAVRVLGGGILVGGIIFLWKAVS
ncbi:MAG: HupE/UreJ family protein [Opitutaceae bacterium]|nr:HupE/UreJ family protein [Opitutaceae bacterium]